MTIPIMQRSARLAGDRRFAPTSTTASILRAIGDSDYAAIGEGWRATAGSPYKHHRLRHDEAAQIGRNNRKTLA